MQKNNDSAVGPAIALLAAIVLIVGLGALWSACGTVSQDEVGFSVGGGPFDSNKNKVKSDLLEPGRHVTGTMDGMWKFPANRTLRFQDFRLAVTTKDGKNATIVGQMDFRFVGEKDPALARKFAEGIGARKYDGERPGEGGKGWEAMLDQLATPEIVATLKDQFGRVYCADFEPQCRVIDPRENIPDSDPENVYQTMSAALQEKIDQKFGGEYLQNIRIRVRSIDLPDVVRQNIDRVTEEQAKTKAAEQSEATAAAEAKAINTKGEALKKNPQAIAIEVAKQCQGGERCTIIVDGSGRGVSASVPVK